MIISGLRNTLPYHMTDSGTNTENAGTLPSAVSPRLFSHVFPHVSAGCILLKPFCTQLIISAVVDQILNSLIEGINDARILVANVEGEGDSIR